MNGIRVVVFENFSVLWIRTSLKQMQNRYADVAQE